MAAAINGDDGASEPGEAGGCRDRLLATRLPEPQQRHWLAAALTALSHQVQMSTLSDPPPLGRRLAVALAVIASPRGVLVVRRRDPLPPWGSPAGRSNRTSPPPRPRSARSPRKPVWRCPGGEIGRRSHAATGRTLVYLACSPTDDTNPTVAAPRELAEVRWVGLDELDQLMLDLYQPAREHLAALLGNDIPRAD
jgi:hypothetical protein